MKHAITALLFALLPTLCPAQDSKPAPGKAATPFVVEPGEVSVPALIDRCATYLGRNILVTERELMIAAPGDQTIRLQQRLETDAKGCEAALANLLHTKGMALTWVDEKAGMMEVLNLAGPRSREVLQRAKSRLVEEVMAMPDFKMAVTTTVPLQHVNATIATNALRPFFASTGSAAPGGSLTIGNVGTGNAMVVSGIQSQVAQAIQLLQRVDVPPAAPSKMQVDLEARLAALEQRIKAIEDKLAAVAGGK